MDNRPADRGLRGDVPVSHTVLVILGGLILLAAIFGLASWRGIPFGRVLPVFAGLWALAAAVNLWVGVRHAGYTLGEELPIFAVVFSVPVAIAWLIARRLG